MSYSNYGFSFQIDLQLPDCLAFHFVLIIIFAVAPFSMPNTNINPHIYANNDYVLSQDFLSNGENVELEMEITLTEMSDV